MTNVQEVYGFGALGMQTNAAKPAGAESKFMQNAQTMITRGLNLDPKSTPKPTKRNVGSIAKQPANVDYTLKAYANHLHIFGGEQSINQNASPLSRSEGVSGALNHLPLTQ